MTFIAPLTLVICLGRRQHAGQPTCFGLTVFIGMEATRSDTVNRRFTWAIRVSCEVKQSVRRLGYIFLSRNKQIVIKIPITATAKWYQLRYILRMTCAMADMLLSPVEPW